MKNIRSHFVFSRSQQNGIFLLVAVIVVLQMVYFFVDFSEEETFSEETAEELVLFQKYIDSLEQASSVKDSIRIYPFNPNFITDYRGYSLGMSIDEIDRLHAFRAEEKWINSAEDFQKVTGISDSLLRQISPYFQFPAWVTAERTKRLTTTEVKPLKVLGSKKDLNTASIEDLMEVKGIGEVLGARIVNYRNKIGGFVDDLQLKDVYGLSYETRSEVLDHFTVQTPVAVNRVNINEATVLELSNVPYINYELAREILDYRLLHEKIRTFEELAKIKEFPSEKIDRIALYLTLK